MIQMEPKSRYAHWMRGSAEQTDGGLETGFADTTFFVVYMSVDPLLNIRIRTFPILRCLCASRSIQLEVVLIFACSMLTHNVRITDKVTTQMRCDLFLSHQLCVSRETAAESTRNVFVARVRSSCLPFRAVSVLVYSSVRFLHRNNRAHESELEHARSAIIYLIDAAHSTLINGYHNIFTIIICIHYCIIVAFIAHCQRRICCALPINTIRCCWVKTIFFY